MNPPSFLTSSVLVALGGAIGSWLRYALSRMIGPARAADFPWATLTANVLGSFAMGLLVGWLARHSDDGEQWRLLLGVGVLGGFTTFSAFAMEFAQLAQKGALATATLYVATSLVAGIAGLFLGLALMRGAA